MQTVGVDTSVFFFPLWLTNCLNYTQNYQEDYCTAKMVSKDNCPQQTAHAKKIPKLNMKDILQIEQSEFNSMAHFVQILIIQWFPDDFF